MNLTKRKLLAILSLELFLYSFVYVPIAVLVALALGIGGGSSGQSRTLLAILYVPPGLILIVNAFIIRKLVLMAAFSESNWRLMRFGLKLMALQIALVVLTFFSGELNVVVGCLAILGLIAAAIVHGEDP